MELVGRQIGSYIVERELGAGGTGTVYLCSHTMIERKVAVKVLHDHLAYQPDQVARFFQEAKAAAEIGHPNIVVIIDFGELQVPGGTRSYLMMECLDGCSLDKRLRTASLTLDQISHILGQCCSALAASHGKGIIHRDLKPANVQLCPRSFDPYFVKLLDFGIAKLATPTAGLRKTQVGVVIGTPAYMSPEQCDGRGLLDHRSDIYSLGVMLYEMLTGRLPFEGEVRDVLLGHLTKAPHPPRLHNASIPAPWEALCLHMMEKSRDARFQSVSEIAQALHDLSGHAAAYASFVTARAASGHSGATMELPDARRPDWAAARPTLQAALGVLTPPDGTPLPSSGSFASLRSPTSAHDAQGGERRPSEREAARTSQALPAAQAASGDHQAPEEAAWRAWRRAGVADDPAPSLGDAEGMAACYTLVTEPRHDRFWATLLARPPARWFNVAELCSASDTPAPPGLPPQPLFCAWMDHPWADPELASVIFVSLQDGSNTVALCRRRTLELLP